MSDVTPDTSSSSLSISFSLNEDRRLSDLTVLAVERDFDIDYERVIDTFSLNHKNSRILLRWIVFLDFLNKIIY